MDVASLLAAQVWIHDAGKDGIVTPEPGKVDKTASHVLEASCSFSFGSPEAVCYLRVAQPSVASGGGGGEGGVAPPSTPSHDIGASGGGAGAGAGAGAKVDASLPKQARLAPQLVTHVPCRLWVRQAPPTAVGLCLWIDGAGTFIVNHTFIDSITVPSATAAQAHPEARLHFARMTMHLQMEHAPGTTSDARAALEAWVNGLYASLPREEQLVASAVQHGGSTQQCHSSFMDLVETIDACAQPILEPHHRWDNAGLGATIAPLSSRIKAVEEALRATMWNAPASHVDDLKKAHRQAKRGLQSAIDVAFASARRKARPTADADGGGQAVVKQLTDAIELQEKTFARSLVAVVLTEQGSPEPGAGTPPSQPPSQ